MDSKVYGNWGESYACEYLKSKKYRIIDRNYRTKSGEIDIIALKNGTLYFIEVKTRLSRRYGEPEEAVTPRKLKKIEKAGQLYCQMHKNLPKKHAIDVVAIMVSERKLKSIKLIHAI